MIAETKPEISVVLYEGPGSHELDVSLKYEVLTSLLDRGFIVQQSTTTEIDSGESKALFIVGALSDSTPTEVVSSDRNLPVKFCNVSQTSAEDVVATIDAELAGLSIEMNQPGKWKPWFPVIDYDRCTNCMQCLSFCLFDVYGVDDANKIQVQNNDNCKTDCPACSRVCPEVAIMFPKYGGGPINGAELTAEDVVGETIKVDISSLLGGDIYGTLRERSESAKQRFARERDDDRALNERKRCLKKLAGMDIPKEVIKDLPSPAEIRQKAEAAKAKAEAVRLKIKQESERN